MVYHVVSKGELFDSPPPAYTVCDKAADGEQRLQKTTFGKNAQRASGSVQREGGLSDLFFLQRSQVIVKTYTEKRFKTMVITEGLATHISFWLAIAGFPGAIYATLVLFNDLWKRYQKSKVRDAEKGHELSDAERALTEMTAKYEAATLEVASSKAKIGSLEDQLAHGINEAVRSIQKMADVEKEMADAKQKTTSLEQKLNQANTTIQLLTAEAATKTHVFESEMKIHTHYLNQRLEDHKEHSARELKAALDNSAKELKTTLDLAANRLRFEKDMSFDKINLARAEARLEARLEAVGGRGGGLREASGRRHEQIQPREAPLAEP